MAYLLANRPTSQLNEIDEYKENSNSQWTIGWWLIAQLTSELQESYYSELEYASVGY